MTVRDIIEYPNDILTTPTDYVMPNEIKSFEIQTLIEDMMDTCHDMEGVGLAANQIGVGKSIFVYRTPGTNSFETIINPNIIKKSQPLHSKGEGCLSLPGKYFNVKRFKKVTIEGLDRNGDPVSIETKSKRLAKIFQHEVDHLNGVLLIKKGKKL